MKALNITKVQDLTLNKPTATIKSVAYDWTNNTASVAVVLKEEGAQYEHLRKFEMSTEGKEVTTLEIENFIKSQLPDFK